MKELVALIDRKAEYSINGLMFLVIIKDVRQVFNRKDVLIEPVSGSKRTWVSRESVKID